MGRLNELLGLYISCYYLKFCLRLFVTLVCFIMDTQHPVQPSRYPISRVTNCRFRYPSGKLSVNISHGPSTGFAELQLCFFGTRVSRQEQAPGLEQPPRARMGNSVGAAFLEKYYVSIYRPQNEKREAREEKPKDELRRKNSKHYSGIDLPDLISHTQAVTPPPLQHIKNSQVQYNIIQVQLDELLGMLNLIWLAFRESQRRKCGCWGQRMSVFHSPMFHTFSSNSFS